MSLRELWDTRVTMSYYLCNYQLFSCFAQLSFEKNIDYCWNYEIKDVGIGKLIKNMLQSFIADVL
jgi:hypothetical protein